MQVAQKLIKLENLWFNHSDFKKNLSNTNEFLADFNLLYIKELSAPIISQTIARVLFVWVWFGPDKTDTQTNGKASYKKSIIAIGPFMNTWK